MRVQGKRVSAALIVRDEAEVIEDCLRSLTGVVDEIVLVDTGSCDATLAIARNYPVTVHHFSWCNDFSAARNYGLDRATGDWILYIDADERLIVPVGCDLDAILGDTSKAAWNVRFHPRLDWTPYAEPRLFRHDPRIRFVGVVHESMRPGIARMAREDGTSTGSSLVTLQHVGYESDQSHKNPRNIPLLRARLAKDPTHPYSWWHLGHCLDLGGDAEGALAAWRKGAEVAVAHPSDAGPLADSLAAVALISALRTRSEPYGELLDFWLQRCPNHLALKWIDALRALESGAPDRVRADLEALAATNPDTFYDPQIAYEKDLFRHHASEALALCHFRSGRYRKAAEFYRRAAKTHPNPAECLTKAQLADMRAAASA